MFKISPAVLSYLETLSHNALIKLIYYFAVTHEDIRLTIEGKSGVNNTKTRNDTAVEHSRQISQTVPEPMTGAHRPQKLQTTQKIFTQSTATTGIANIFTQSITESAAADTVTLSHTVVNRNSTAQEKINLYTSLFVGRKDVFALRWYNAKSNKSGYSPVCENKWKIGKCDMKKYSCAGIF